MKDKNSLQQTVVKRIVNSAINSRNFVILFTALQHTLLISISKCRFSMLSKYLNLSFVLFVQNWLTSQLNLHLHFHPIVHQSLAGRQRSLVWSGSVDIYIYIVASQLSKYLSNNIQHGGALQIKFSFISSDCRAGFVCVCL